MFALTVLTTKSVKNFSVCVSAKKGARISKSYNTTQRQNSQQEKIKMSKEKYIEPKIEVIKFATADIITTSTGAFDGEWVPIGGESDEEVF